jgi:hypothetical protein
MKLEEHQLPLYIYSEFSSHLNFENCGFFYTPYIQYLYFQLDFGIHPGYNGLDSLPFVDEIDAEEIDLLLISQ